MTDFDQLHEQVTEQQAADSIINKFGIQPENLTVLSEELGVSSTVLCNFFTIIEQQHVPIDALDSMLREMSKNYLNMMLQVNSLDAVDPEIRELQTKAKINLEQCKFTEAEAHLKKVLEIETGVGKDITDTLNLQIMSAASSLYMLGLCKLTQIQYTEAVVYFEQALKWLPHSHKQRSEYLNQCGAIFYELGDHDKAIEYYELVLAIDLKIFGPDHPQVATYRNNIGLAWANKGECDKAIEYYELAMASDLKTFGPDHPNVAIRGNNIGLALEAKGDYDLAIENYVISLRILEANLGYDHPTTNMVRLNLDSARAYLVLSE